MRVEVELDWRLAGDVARDKDGRLVFPSGLDPAPGIYWFRFEGADPRWHYVGGDGQR